MAKGAHLEKHQFQKGHPGGPGRPKGSRAKLQEMAVAVLAADFEQHGEDVVRRVREKRPEVYLASVVSLLPKQAQKLESPFIDLSDQEMDQLEQLLAAMRAKTVEELEQANPAPAHAPVPRQRHILNGSAVRRQQEVEACRQPIASADTPLDCGTTTATDPAISCDASGSSTTDGTDDQGKADSTDGGTRNDRQGTAETCEHQGVLPGSGLGSRTGKPE